MPIKIEILAQNVQELMLTFEDFLAGRMIPTPDIHAQETIATTVVAPPEAVKAVKTANQMQEEINKAPAAKPPAKATKKSNGKSKVKPLPADVDPLAASEEDGEEASEEEDPFTENPNGRELDASEKIKLATDKLRDIFSHAKGSAGVRALKEKYAVGFFHQVPPARAQEFLDDALRLEKEIAA